MIENNVPHLVIGDDCPGRRCQVVKNKHGQAWRIAFRRSALRFRRVGFEPALPRTSPVPVFHATVNRASTAAFCARRSAEVRLAAPRGSEENQATAGLDVLLDSFHVVFARTVALTVFCAALLAHTKILSRW